MILEAALQAIAPRPAMRTIDWALQYGYTEFGQPYNDFAYPHLSAPGGPFDAFDCSQYFDIWLQWASRLGKTFGGQICLMKQADSKPCPMMFASADEKLAVEVVERTYGMLDHCEPLSKYLPGKRERRQDRIKLRTCRVYVAWSRSVSTLADKGVRFLHCSEIDKWEHPGAASGNAKEADPLKLADDRTKEFPTYKRWKESTPAEKRASRVERGRLSSCNASLHVPCHHCYRYQPLIFGEGEGAGVQWEKLSSGRSDKELARRTGHYVCAHCKEAIVDSDRGWMMRNGVWVPEGCGVDDSKALSVVETWRKPGREAWRGWKESPWITGEPLRDGRDWGSQLSSLYALSRSWGDIAAEFVETKGKPQNLRNFKNQWLAETWETIRSGATWEELGNRIIEPRRERAVVPAWASCVYAGIDRQGMDVDRFPYVVDAFGPGPRVATIAYGEVDSFDKIRTEVLANDWRHEDGGAPLRIGFALFDSGYRPDGVYEFCQKCHQLGIDVWPSKGSNSSLKADWERTLLGKDTSAHGLWLYRIDTIRTQLWIEDQLRKKAKGDDDGYSLFGGSLFDHQDFLEQLLNDAAVTDNDSHGHERTSWDRVRPNDPNDMRDARRYAYAAMLIHTRGHIKSRDYKPPHVPAAQPPSRIREMKFRR